MPPLAGWQRNWICRGSIATRKSSDMLPSGAKVVASATKGGATDRQHTYSPLNQPALWAEPIGQCVST